MDAQDQNRTSPPGHGVHLCSKCGWPFPNPHPSSRHRRAHKKVCGTVEGYVMNISHSGRASDDSDDDMRTPSPTLSLDKENMKELGSSGGSGSGILRSYKSEDELFSDAVTEFSESASAYNPSPRESMDRVKQLGTNAGKELEKDLFDAQQTKDEEHNGVKKVNDESITGSEETVKIKPSHLESFKSANDIKFVEVPVGVDQTDGEPISSPEIASENGNSDKAKELISSKPDTHVEGKISVPELEISTEHVSSPTASATVEPTLEARSDEFKNLEHEELFNVTPEVESIKPANDIEVVEVPVGVGQIDGEAFSSPEIASENGNSDKAKELISCEPDTHDEEKTSVPELEFSTVHVASPTDSEIKEPNRSDEFKTLGYEHVELVNVTPEVDRKTSDTVILEPMLHEADILHSSAMDEATGQESELLTVSETVKLGHVLDRDGTEQELQDQTNTLQVDKAELDLSSQTVPPKHADISSTRQVEADSTVEFGNVMLTEDNELEVEGCKEVPLVPVSEPLQVIEKPEIMIEDFKDDEVLKSRFPLDLGNDEQEVAEPDVISQPDFGTSINLQKDALESVGEEIDSTTLQVISNEGTSNGTETYHNTLNHFPEVNLEATKGLALGSNNELGSTGPLGADSEFPEDGVVSDKQLEISKDAEAQRPITSVGDISELNLVNQDEGTRKNLDDSVYDEPAAPVISSKILTAVEDKHNEDPVETELLIDNAENKLRAEDLSVSAVDDSAKSCSRTESLEGNWGSVSVLSTQSDGTTQTDAEALEKPEGTLLKPQTTSDAYRPEKSDVYEPPSFMTLVKSRSENEKTVETSEITEPSKSEAVDAGWIPSLTNVVNDSEGRKKNEEMIAKVTNWSPGKQHSPLKNLLNEANAETKAETETVEKQLPQKDHADETASKINGSGVATVSSIMGSETPVHDAAKREMEKEWNSPAKYPTVIKKEKKKSKPYWVPLLCCASAQRDM